MASEKLDEKAIFNIARQIDSPDARREYLRQICGEDNSLLGRVETLLRGYEEQASFLESPPSAIVAIADPTIDQPITEKPGVQIGPYKLLQQIGEGGMGVVYMAEQSEPVQRKVALKVIKPGMDSRQVIARFEAERQALAMMDHVNIARVLDAGATESGRPYFVMELVHGVPITKYCDDNRLTPRQRLELFVPVCQAIQHAHQKGIIHRDIKPSNVMVTLYDGKPVPKVIDFGVAKATEQKLTERTLFTQYGTMVGTLEYMSPEQAEMSALGIDTRSDIYSLGVLLYELLTGSTPLSSKRMKEAAYGEILRLIKEEEPPKPSTRLSDSGEALASISAQRHTEPAKLSKLMRGELDWIVMKTLEKDRNRRYETANAFAADVQRYLEDEPVLACPPSAWYRFHKFARRNKAAIGVAGMVLFFLVLLGSGAGWAVRDRTAREEEFARERALKQTAVEHEVNLALNEAERLQEQAKWPEALSAAKRAQGLLAGGGSDELRERSHQLRKDLEMVLRLEEIRLLRSEIMANIFDNESVDRAYAQAFADYGIDVVGLPVEEAAARIRARAGVAVALAVALNDWACVRSFKDNAGRLALTAVAQAADPDPWRRQVRQAAHVQQLDTKSLTALATSPELLRQQPASVLALGTALQYRGLSETRVAVLRQAQRQYPGDFWINLQLAQSLSQKGTTSWDEAVRFYSVALALRPGSIFVLNDLGIALNAQGKLDEAIACYRKAIELDPKYAGAHSNLGIALRDKGLQDEVIACYRKAIELDPKLAMAHNNLGLALKDKGLLDEAIACHRKAIELDPKLAMAHYSLGIALYDQKKLDEAIVAYRKAVELDPKYANAYHNLGYLLYAQKKLDEAIVAYRKAIELDPKHAMAHNNLGRALKDKGLLDEAVDAYNKAIELDPKLAMAYNNLGNALYDQKKLDEAIVAYRKAVELDPKYALAHNNLGKALRAQKKLDEAVAAFETAIELDTKNANFYIPLGNLFCEDLAEYDKAIECFRTAIKLDEKLVVARENLCLALGYKGFAFVNDPKPESRDPKQAMEAVSEAFKVSPQSAAAWQFLGWIQYRLGNWPASIESLEKSCKLQEGSTGDYGQWIVLALAHARLAAQDGLPEKARESHQIEARRRYDAANKQIDAMWRERPLDPSFGQTFWDLRAEARELIGAKEDKK